MIVSAQRVGATAQKLMFFEKSLTNNLLPAGFAHVPGGDAYRNQSVYSFHDYCLTYGTHFVEIVCVCVSQNVHRLFCR